MDELSPDRNCRGIGVILHVVLERHSMFGASGQYAVSRNCIANRAVSWRQQEISECNGWFQSAAALRQPEPSSVCATGVSVRGQTIRGGRWVLTWAGSLGITVGRACD